MQLHGGNVPCNCVYVGERNSGTRAVWVGWVKEVMCGDANIKFELSLRCSNEDVKWEVSVCFGYHRRLQACDTIFDWSWNYLKIK